MPGAADHDAVEVINGQGQGPWLLVCEHASNLIPPEFDGLGLDASARQSHIAWDLGALALARALSALLDAPLVAQRFSRLLYDCNRPPEAPSSIPAASEAYTIPGNAGLTDEARAERVARFYAPFRACLARIIAERVAAGSPPVLVTVHSFTPVYLSKPRATGLGVLHDTDHRLADALLETLPSRPGLKIERNRPYGPADGVTHTLIEHGVRNRLLNVMLEIRNDLIAENAEQTAMATWLAKGLTVALTKLEQTPEGRELA